MTAVAKNHEKFADFCAETGRDPAGYEHCALGAKAGQGRERVSRFMPAQGTAFVVKTQTSPPETFKKAMRNHRLAFNSGASVPRVFWVYEDSQTVVMEYVDGQTAAHGLLVEPLKVMRRAGTWLGDLHRRSDVSTRAFQPRFMSAHIERLLAEAKSGARRIPASRKFAAHVAELQRFAKAAEGVEVTSAANHGNFVPKNLLLAERRACGLDLGAYNTAPVAYDLSRFLIAAQTALGQTDWHQDYVIAPEPLDAFLIGYGQIKRDDPVLQFLLRARLLVDWATLQNGGLSLKRWRRWQSLKRGAGVVL